MMPPAFSASTPGMSMQLQKGSFAHILVVRVSAGCLGPSAAALTHFAVLLSTAAVPLLLHSPSSQALGASWCINNNNSRPLSPETVGAVRRRSMLHDDRHSRHSSGRGAALGAPGRDQQRLCQHVSTVWGCVRH